MPAGIIATVDNGWATIDFVDQSLRGQALADLVEIGGPGSIETITRDGPRRKYRVPEQFAQTAGLLDGDEVGRVHSAGQDTGAAAALVAADPNVNPGADNANWHTPVAEHTSANAYVGTVSNDTVLDRVQVHTGDASSYGGSGNSPLHSDLVKMVTELKYPPAPEAPIQGLMSTFTETGGDGDTPELVERAGAFNAGFSTHDGALATDPGATQADPDSAAAVSGALAVQTGAQATDPGATPEAGGGVVASDYTTVQSTREPETEYTQAFTGEVTSVTEITADGEPVTEADGGDDPEALTEGQSTTPDPAPASPFAGKITDANGAARPNVPEGDPNADWKRPELDAYAMWKGLDPSQYGNKAELANALNALNKGE